METGGWFGILVGCIVLLIIDYLISREFQRIAEMKGHTDSNKYLWITFFFTWVGMLLVIALPDRAQSVKVEAPRKAEINDELPEL